jgi:signal transduction histidine kinase
VKALEYLCDRTRGTLKLNPRLEVSGAPVRLTAEVETALFRIVQEALTNVSRHACTQEVKVSLAYLPEEVRLSVSDAGTGFDVSAERRGWGLVGMSERAEAVGGHFKAQSTPGEGTTLTAYVPILSGEIQ